MKHINPHTVGHALKTGGRNGLYHKLVTEFSFVILLKAVRQPLGIKSSASVLHEL